MNYSHPYRQVESSSPVSYSRSSRSTPSPSKDQSPLPRYSSSSSSTPSSPTSSLNSYQSSSSREEAKIKLEPLLFTPTQPLWKAAKDLFKSKGKAAKKMDDDADLPAPALTKEEVEVAKEMYDAWMNRF